MKKICYLLFILMGFFACNDKNEIVEVSKVSLDKNEIVMLVGNQVTLKAEVTPSNAINTDLTWLSSDNDVATVSEGVVTAVAEGEAIITAESANGVKGQCSVTVNKNDEESDLTTIEFDHYSTNVKLVSCNDGLFRWTLTFIDKEAHDSYIYYYSKGYLLSVDIYSEENTFAKGIPTGDFDLISPVDNDQNNKVRVKRVDNEFTMDEFLTEGTLSVKKEGDSYSFVFNINNGVYCFDNTINVDTKDATLFEISNSAYNSTLAGDLISTKEFDKAVYYFSTSGPELYLGSEGITISSNGLTSGNGSVMQIYRNTDFNNFAKEEFKLDGTFPITSDVDPNVIQAGYNSSWGDYTFGSWYYTIDGDYKRHEKAPLAAGNIIIELNDEKNYIKVTIQCQDDALPQANRIEVIYEGECTYMDPDQTGDFGSCSAGFYGPFEYDSPNMNWSIQLMSNEFKKSGGYYNQGTGPVYMFDMLSLATSKWYDGFTEGTYKLDLNNNYGEMSIPRAEVWNYTNGSYDINNDVVAITEATVVVEMIKDGSSRYMISIDAKDANGVAISGVYQGGVEVQNMATPPMQNRIFNSNDAEVTFLYMGEDRFGRTNWSVEMIEAGANRENGMAAEGLILSFNVFVEAGHTFDKGMPTGKFELYQPEMDDYYGMEINGEGKYGISNDAYTLFHIVFQGDTGNARAWTDGSLTIEENDGNYSVNIDMLSQAKNASTGDIYKFTMKGDYSGKVNHEDFMNPNIPYLKSKAKKAAPKKDMRMFSKTGK